MRVRRSSLRSARSAVESPQKGMMAAAEEGGAGCYAGGDEDWDGVGEDKEEQRHGGGAAAVTPPGGFFPFPWRRSSLWSMTTKSNWAAQILQLASLAWEQERGVAVVVLLAV
jgi:hypothetical protein